MGALFTCCQKPSTTDSDHRVQHEVVNVRNGEVHVEQVDDTNKNYTPVADTQVEVEISGKESREEVDDEMVTAVVETRNYAAPPPPKTEEPQEKRRSRSPPRPKEERREQRTEEQTEWRSPRTSIVREAPSEESSGTTARPTSARTFGASSGSGGRRTVPADDDEPSSNTGRPTSARPYGGGGSGYRTTTMVETTETRVTRSSIPTLKTSPSPPNSTSKEEPRQRPKVTIVREFES